MNICITKLENLENRILAIDNLIANKRRLCGDEKQIAQDLLKNLKQWLKEEYRRVSSTHGEAGLNPIELAYYAPAVYEVITRIRIKTNSIPNQIWTSELYDAASTVRFYLDGLCGKLNSK